MRYWKRADKKGKTLTVESYSHGLTIEDAISISKEEFEEYLESLPKNQLVTRDLLKEIDDIKEEIKKLKK